jgi:hypothetical protein
LRKSQIRREKCAKACHVGATIFFPSTNQAFFSSLPVDNIPCSPSGHEVEIHDKLHPHNKKHGITATLDRTFYAFLDLGGIVETRCKDWAFV